MQLAPLPRCDHRSIGAKEPPVYLIHSDDRLMSPAHTTASSWPAPNSIASSAKPDVPARRNDRPRQAGLLDQLHQAHHVRRLHTWHRLVSVDGEGVDHALSAQRLGSHVHRAARPAHRRRGVQVGAAALAVQQPQNPVRASVPEVGVAIGDLRPDLMKGFVHDVRRSHQRAPSGGTRGHRTRVPPRAVSQLQRSTDPPRAPFDRVPDRPACTSLGVRRTSASARRRAER